jgi:hypothetical protein
MATYIVVSNGKLISTHSTLMNAKKSAKSGTQRTGTGHRISKEVGIVSGAKGYPFIRL